MSIPHTLVVVDNFSYLKQSQSLEYIEQEVSFII